MLRGLEGRRVAVFASPKDSAEERAAVMTQALERAGARIHLLSESSASDQDYHGAKYAALVLVGDEGAQFEIEPRLVQLAREFLASDKPVAALPKLEKRCPMLKFQKHLRMRAKLASQKTTCWRMCTIVMV